jgi:hypothetical protein
VSILGNAIIGGNSRLWGRVVVLDFARADGNSRISGCVQMKDNSHATNDAVIYGPILLEKDDKITDCSLVTNCDSDSDSSSLCPPAPTITGCI